jgi:hypothetical protein
MIVPLGRRPEAARDSLSYFGDPCHLHEDRMEPRNIIIHSR